MSTIASPRDSPAPQNRRMNSSQALVTPTSSTRPSLDLPHSASGSPNPNSNNPPTAINKRANRAALREYYNLQKAAAVNNATPGTPTLEITSESGLTSPSSLHDSSSFMPPSELDAPNFNAPEFITKTLASSSLSELLRTYARILGEIRALDAEKKALVYDNYSKLISATETIRKMRTTMDPLNPMASTLDLVVAKIYEQASGIREELRRGVARPEKGRRKTTGGGGSDSEESEGSEGEADTEEERHRRMVQTRALAVEVLEVPGRLRRLIREGEKDEARKEWEVPRRLLKRWRERGVGGADVDELIREGDSIVASSRGDD